MAPRTTVLASLAGALLLTACSGGADPRPDAGAPVDRTPTSSPSTSPSSSPSSSPSTSPSRSALPEAASRISVPGLAAQRFSGGDLRLGRVRERTAAYTSYDVDYRSDDLRVSGVLNVPDGDGPFPAAVLAHGYIDPAVYVQGQGMTRERAYLAERGYVVLHVDYRNHAASTPDPDAEREMRLGYAADVINAVTALRSAGRSGEVPVDGGRIGLVGRSMGGGVVQNVLVARPGLVDAAVLFASVSSDAADNFDRWVRGNDGRSALAAYVDRTYGLPEDDPRFWRELSPRTYVDAITEPVLIHQGGSDDECPPVWARQTYRAMQRGGVDVQLRWYPDEEHAFGPQFERAMATTTTFLDARLA